VEELVNSLIESETLIRDNGNWKITRSISESEISSTIHGVISGRVDRLEKETKRILQEALVIGRASFYAILKRITELEDLIDRGLSMLERLDLIRTRSIQPDLEYMFKHALTQEVVYNGLLKKERQEIHERIALVMEQLFQDRLPEFYETLAFHFSQARSLHKAVDYLIKSGEKSVKRYAVKGKGARVDVSEGMLLVALGRGRLPGILDITARHSFVVFGTMDRKVLAGLTACVVGSTAYALPVYFYETG